MKEGGMDKLQGKKIVNIYHDSAYGKETIPVLDVQAKKYGFQVTHIAVPRPGNEQQAQWLQIRQIKPDWVIRRGWGVMNPTALKAAAKIGFPRDRIVGVWWSGAEEDVIPAGDAAKGYIAAGFNLPGTNFPVMQDILKNVYKKGKGEMEDSSRIGSIYHTRGVVAGIITAEAIRTAQAQFGKGKPMTGEQVRWGIEHLNIDDKRLKGLGATGLMQSLEVQERQIVALLGANGAGKTTTLKAISNLLRAERGEVTKGQIVFRGERIDQLNPAGLVKRGICQVMEGRHCFQHLSVEENLLTGAYSRGALGAGLREDLEKVYAYFPRLKERRHSQSGYTSGGEQQMTAIR